MLSVAGATVQPRLVLCEDAALSGGKLPFILNLYALNELDH